MGKASQPAVEFNKVKPKTRNQSLFIKSIEENNLTICHGPSGTGKTLCAIGYACEALLAGRIDKILVSRTIVACGDLGALPGDESEKSAPYFIPYFEYLERILGRQYRSFLHKQILLRPLELLRGHTYDRTALILDEAQNADAKQIKLFISRMGTDAKVILIGDESQSDASATGFRFCINFLENISGVAIVKFDYGDILRNRELAPILAVFDKNGY